MEFYIIRTEDDKARVREAIDIWPPIRPFSVELKEYRKNRTDSQNRLMWMWINIVSDHTGHHPDELHEMFKQRLLGTVKCGILGDEYDVTRTTKTLTTKEFTDYLERIEQACALLQIKLPHPDDYAFAMSERD